jgi:hypothetical protein
MRTWQRRKLTKTDGEHILLRILDRCGEERISRNERNRSCEEELILRLLIEYFPEN